MLLEEYKWHLYDGPENYFQCKTIVHVRALIYILILSYVLYSEITKSFAKLKYGVSLSFYTPFQFETQNILTQKKRKTNFCTYDGLQLQVSKFGECKTKCHLRWSGKLFNNWARCSLNSCSKLCSPYNDIFFNFMQKTQFRQKCLCDSDISAHDLFSINIITSFKQQLIQTKRIKITYYYNMMEVQMHHKVNTMRAQTPSDYIFFLASGIVKHHV